MQKWTLDRGCSKKLKFWNSLGIAMMAALFVCSGCSVTVGGSTTPPPQEIAYSSSGGGAVYVLTLNVNGVDGAYKLTVLGSDGTVHISTGTYTGTNTITLNPSQGNTINITINGGAMSNINVEGGNNITLTPVTPDTSEKKIIINDYSGTNFEGNKKGRTCLVVPVGADPKLLQAPYIGAFKNSFSVEETTATITLHKYNAVNTDLGVWTGSGVYDLYVYPAGMNDSSACYKAGNIPILTATTTLAHSAFTKQKAFDDWTGSVTVNNIPGELSGQRIAVFGQAADSGKGLLWCGEDMDDNEMDIKTLVINNTTMVVPIVFGRFTGQWNKVKISVQITTQSTYSMNGSFFTPAKVWNNISFGGSSGNRTATVNWDSP